MDALNRGDIVLLSVLDPSGHGSKVRPVVVVSDPSVDDGLVIGVCVSSRIESPCPPHHVILPYHPQGHVRTGLVRPCVAKCDWRVSFAEGEQIRTIGTLPHATLTAVVFQVRAIET